MPFKWVEPDVFLVHNGVTVYHAYDDFVVDRLGDWYGTSSTEEDGHIFDVRDLPLPDEADHDDHKTIIKAAIDAGTIRELDSDEWYDEGAIINWDKVPQQQRKEKE